jgi:hypothetical protein
MDVVEFVVNKQYPVQNFLEIALWQEHGLACLMVRVMVNV